MCSHVLCPVRTKVPKVFASSVPRLFIKCRKMRFKMNDFDLTFFPPSPPQIFEGLADEHDLR